MREGNVTLAVVRGSYLTVWNPKKVRLDFVREADEMKMAQHFSAGIMSRFKVESVKRTTELIEILNVSAVRFTDDNHAYFPTIAT